MPPSCPHLGAASDPHTSFSYPSPAGYCYAVIRPGPVRMDHQVAACLTPRYSICPIYQAALDRTADPPPSAFTPTRPIPHSLPPDLAPLPPDDDRPFFLRYWPRLFAGLAVCAVLVFLTIYSLPGKDGQIPILGELLSQPTARQAAPARPDASTPRGLHGTDSVAFGDIASPSAQHTAIGSSQAPDTVEPERSAHAAISTLLITGTPAVPTGSAGPTAFIDRLPPWILHTVKTGETVAALAETYMTTPAVLQAVNPVVARRVQLEADLRESGLSFEGGSLWPGTLLVVYPGVDDPDGLVPLQAVNLERPANLGDVAFALGLTRIELLRWNPNAPDRLPADSWVVAPAPEQ